MRRTPFERILVTGGTGFIGRYVTARLVAAGHRPTVTVYGRIPSDFAHTDAVDLLHLDIRDRDEAAKTVNSIRPQIVIHLAGVTGQSDGNGNLCDEVNYRATVDLLDRFAETSVSKVVMVGTAAEYGAGTTPFGEDQPDDPRSPYALSRAKANRYALSLAESSALSVSVLRLFSVYGIGQPANMFLPQLITHAVSGREFRMTEGSQIRDFVHVEDVATALIAAAGHTGNTLINIGGGVGYRLADLARTVWRYCEADPVMLRIGALQPVGDGSFDTLADIGRAKQLLGWTPRRQFLAGSGVGDALAEMIEHTRMVQGANG
jgi:nucleoside-diphosphate-sugar epimerase